MNRERRFSSVDAALRFFYRAEEILSSKGSLWFDPEQIRSPTRGEKREELLFDFLSIASALKSLNSLQNWLMRELYRPRKASERPRIVTRVCALGRARFPKVRWTLQGIGRLRQSTLKQIAPELKRRQLILDDHDIAPGSNRPNQLTGVINANNRTSTKQTNHSEHAVSGVPSAPRAPLHRKREVIFDKTSAGY